MMLHLLLLFCLLDDADDAIARFKKAYADSRLDQRVAAVTELGRVQGEKVLKLLGALLLQDDAMVRVEAARAIAGFEEGKSFAVRLLLAALGPNAKSEAVQEQVLKSLGILKEEAAVPTVNQMLDEKPNDVAKAAVEAAGGIRSKASIEPLLELLKKLEKLGVLGRSSGRQVGLPGSVRRDSNKEAQERYQALHKPCLDALTSITKERFKKHDDWMVWWAKSKAAFLVPRD